MYFSLRFKFLSNQGNAEKDVAMLKEVKNNNHGFFPDRHPICPLSKVEILPKVIV